MQATVVTLFYLTSSISMRPGHSGRPQQNISIFMA
jgi:hypothetical protein